MTPYSAVFVKFLSKITDYDLPMFPEEDLEEMMCGWLMTAIVNFTRPVSNLDDRDEENKQFNVELKNYEIEVLALYMVVAWLDQRINSVLLTNQMFSGKEEKHFSQAQHMKELKALRDATYTEARKLPRDYGYVASSYFD